LLDIVAKQREIVLFHVSLKSLENVAEEKYDLDAPENRHEADDNIIESTCAASGGFDDKYTLIKKSFY
jgi:hypothetical protein